MLITKERENKGKGNEFPKLILEDDNISKQQVAKAEESGMSTREVITFMLFCISYVVVVVMQTDVGTSYVMNEAFLSQQKEKGLDFQQITTEDEYWTWLDGFISLIYKDVYYSDFKIPAGKKHSIPNLNKMVSRFRFTQRRMLLVPNTDQYSSAYVSSGWASTGFAVSDSFDGSQESTESFGTNGTTYNYTVEGSYRKLGGFVMTTDIFTKSEAELKNLTQQMKYSGYIDKQTRVIIIDFVCYNSYVGYFNKYFLVATFKANGLLECYYDVYNMKKNYYEGWRGMLRLIVEIILVLLLFFYFFMEVREIIQDVGTQRKEWVKEQQKLDAKQKKLREKKKKKQQDQGDQDKAGDKKDKEENDEQKVEDEPPFESELEKQKKSKKLFIINYMKFVVKGIKGHYNEVWNWVDSLILILAFSSCFYWAKLLQMHLPNVAALDNVILETDEQNEVFTSIAFSLISYQNLISFNFIPIFFKLLKYLSFWFERAKLIFRTLAYAQSDILYFLIMYMVIFFAFVVMCHIYYGADITDFSDVFVSLATLFQMLLGDLDYLDSMIELNEVLSFFFFIAFITSMQFILINMFIAFIANSYTEANNRGQTSKTLEDELKQKHWSVKIQEILQKMKAKRNLKKELMKLERQKTMQAKKEKGKAKLSGLMQKRLGKQFAKASENAATGGKKKNKKMENPMGADPLESKEKDKFEKSDPEMDEEKGGVASGKQSDQPLDPNKITLLIGTSSRGSKGDEETQNKDDVTAVNPLSQLMQASKKLKQVNATDNDAGDPILDEDEDSQEEEDHKKSQKKVEEEKAKHILTSKEWDKIFDLNQASIDDPLIPALMSEKQDDQQVKEKEVKCGRIMWASIAFSIYVTIYIAIILVQVSAQKNYQYNSAIKTTITEIADDNQQTILDAEEYNDVTNWLTQAFPKIGEIINQTETNYLGFYILDVNYVLDNSFKMCFRLSQQYDTSYNANISYKPEYYKEDFDTHEYKDTFLGIKTGKTYTYSSDGFQGTGGYCMSMNFIKDYTTSMNNFLSDHIISDKMYELSIEFVTFEASQYVHTYVGIDFQFPPQGSVDVALTIFTMDLAPYREREDKVRLAFESLYLLLLIYNVYIFLKKVISKNNQYKRWQKIEVDILEDIEKKQRHKKKPEWFRKCDAIFDIFAWIDTIYFSLALTSVIQWALFVLNAAQADITLPPNDSTLSFVPSIYNVMRLMQNYTYVAVINTIFLSVKLFDYMNKSKHMNMLSKTLYSSREDIFYFLLIFIVLMMGFVFLSFISFGWLLEGYSTFGNSIRSCFQVTIGDFNYSDLTSASSRMSYLFFFPFNILFVFILTNIFLAIINEAYENNRMQQSDDDDVNTLTSIMYCMKKKQKEGRQRKVTDIDSKHANNDHLEIFERLVVNFQSGIEEDKGDEENNMERQLKSWAMTCAEEIRAELEHRTKLRNENKATLYYLYKDSDKDKKDSVGGSAVPYRKMDQVEMLKKRLQYWNYIRCGIQFISFQNKMLETVIKQKEREIEALTEQYREEKEKTAQLYKYLALLEKPVQQKFEQVVHYKNLFGMLKKETELLTEQKKMEEELLEQLEQEKKTQKKAIDKAEQSETQTVYSSRRRGGKDKQD